MYLNYFIMKVCIHCSLFYCNAVYLCGSVHFKNSMGKHFNFCFGIMYLEGISCFEAVQYLLSKSGVLPVLGVLHTRVVSHLADVVLSQ